MLDSPGGSNHENDVGHPLLWRDEDGVVIAECPDVPGCVSQGRTRANAIRNVQSALRECLDVRREVGLPPHRRDQNWVTVMAISRRC